MQKSDRGLVYFFIRSKDSECKLLLPTPVADLMVQERAFNVRKSMIEAEDYSEKHKYKTLTNMKEGNSGRTQK